MRPLIWTVPVAVPVAMGLLACLAIAAPASAQIDAGYLIRASGCGPGASVESDSENFVLREGGAGTVSPETAFTSCTSSVDAAMGQLAADATLSRVAPSSFLTPVSASARLQERIYISGLGAGETAYITATLGVGGGASVVGASGLAQGFGRLEIANCVVSTTLRSDGVTNLGSDTCNLGVVVDPLSMTIALEIPFGALTFSYVDLEASVSGSIQTLGNGGVGTASAIGFLSIEAAGDQTFRFANPETLTVPEPSATGLGLSALAALRARAGRRTS